jgi:uncharacterized membrane protein YdbT with pleckstrin-like domain
MPDQEKTQEALSASDSATMWSQDEYHFHGQRANEHILLVRNQHPIVLGRVSLLSLVSLVLPYLIIRFTGGKFESYTLAIYVFIVLFYIAYHLYGYRNSISVLSNERILSILQKGFFNRRIVEAELDRIQDVSSDIKGIMQTSFGFGDVTIRTASKDSLLMLKNIGDPYDVQQAIVRAQKENSND